MSKKTKIIYSEPASYFPENIRKEFGLGEYADEGNDDTNINTNENVRINDGQNEANPEIRDI